jgi:hypothetical protein
LGLLAMDVVAKPRAGLPAGFFFLAMFQRLWVCGRRPRFSGRQGNFRKG